MDEAEKLIASLQAQGRQVWLAGPQTEETIAELERVLAVRLPPSYRAFLTQFGAVTVQGASVSGILGGQPLGQGPGGLYADTLRLRAENGLPDHLLVIQPDDRFPYCLDISRSSLEGEYPVVCYQFEAQRVEHLADTFAEWLVEWLLRPAVEGES
jgi:hypothetical protein